MNEEPLSAEAAALQSIAKSLEGIGKNLASINRILSTWAAFSPTFDRPLGKNSKLAVSTWRNRALGVLVRRFGEKPTGK